MQPQMCSLASHSPPDAGWQDKVGTHASPPIPYGANKPKTMSRNRLALCLRFCRYSRCTVPHRKCMRPGGLPWSNVQLRIRSETSKSLQDICAERSSGLSGPGSGSWAPELLGSWVAGSQEGAIRQNVLATSRLTCMKFRLVLICTRLARRKDTAEIFAFGLRTPREVLGVLGVLWSAMRTRTA